MANHLAENKPAPDRPVINKLSNMINTSGKEENKGEEEKKEEAKVEP